MRTNPSLRREVETVVHSLTRNALEAFWENQEAQGAPVAVAEVPLYFETGWQTAFTPRPHDRERPDGFYRCGLSRKRRYAKNRAGIQAV